MKLLRPQDKGRQHFYLACSFSKLNIGSSPFKPSKIIIDEGKEFDSVCINCHDLPCLKFSSEELIPIGIKGFPYNHADTVCPWDAINISVNGFPAIDLEKCTACGICLARCPMQAIFINKQCIAEISRNKNKYLIAEKDVDDSSKHKKLIRYLKERGHQYSIEKFPKKFIGSILENIIIARFGNVYFENILIRNLLIALGVSSFIRATGDTNIRMDIMFNVENTIGFGEVDFNEVSLIDSPRSVLESYAVLHSRYGIPKEKLMPIVVCLNFPNKRSDYYEVIMDIDKVLQVKMKTIPVGALLYLLWARKKLRRGDLEKRFLVTKKNPSIKEDLRSLLLEKFKYFPMIDTEYFGAVK